MSKSREYVGDGIVVRYDLGRCIHAAECVKGLPTVFDVKKRPWVDPHAASPERIAETIRSCPSGALTYRRMDGGPQEAPPPASVRLEPNGPLYVEGEIALADHEGNPIDAGVRAALCRCGHSKNKPFCDRSHEQAGFRG